jgi:uncharacterized protein YicC (UPF0701 family)
MSAFEGSQLQESLEQRREEIQRLKAQVRREGPTLSADDIETIALQLYKEAHPVKERCCVCMGGPAQYVRVNDYLGRCTCTCHQK